MCLVLEAIDCPLTSVATCFLFTVYSCGTFSFPFLAEECLLFLVATSLALGLSLNRRSPALFSSNAESHRFVLLYIEPVELHFLQVSTPNLPSDMPSSM